MNTPDIQIKRGGEFLPPVTADSIPGKIKAGFLLSDDLYFDTSTETWKPLTDWKPTFVRRTVFLHQTEHSHPPAEAPRAEPAMVEYTDARRGPMRPTGVVRMEHDASTRPQQVEPPGDAESTPPPNDSKWQPQSRRDRQNRHRYILLLVSWVVAAVSLVSLLAVWSYSQQLAGNVRLLQEDNTSLRETIAASQTQMETLNLIAPPGTVRCMVTFSPGEGRFVGMISVPVALYHRADVEKALASLGTIGASAPASFGESLRQLKDLLPSPITISLTNSAGRTDIAVPEPGEYVLVCMPSRKVGKVSHHFLWLVGFEARDQPSFGILLSAKNSVSSSNPNFEIRDVDAPAPDRKTQ